MNMLVELQLDSLHTAVSLYANILRVFQLISQFSLDIIMFLIIPKCKNSF